MSPSAVCVPTPPTSSPHPTLADGWILDLCWSHLAPGGCVCVLVWVFPKARHGFLTLVHLETAAGSTYSGRREEDWWSVRHGSVGTWGSVLLGTLQRCAIAPWSKKDRDPQSRLSLVRGDLGHWFPSFSWHWSLGLLGGGLREVGSLWVGKETRLSFLLIPLTSPANMNITL